MEVAIALSIAAVLAALCAVVLFQRDRRRSFGAPSVERSSATESSARDSEADFEEWERELRKQH